MARKQRLSGSLTVRLSAPLERRLKARAAKAGKTPSELVRSLIEQEVSEAQGGKTLYERAAHLLENARGSTKVAFGENAREELEKWNPDRAEEEQITDVLTLDRRGFLTYRLKGGRRFRLLPE